MLLSSRLLQHTSNTTSPAPLPSINLYTLSSLPSLPLHHFSLIALWYLARSNGLWAQIYILVTWSFSPPTLHVCSCPSGATWQHLHSKHASLCLCQQHEISQPWGWTLSVYTLVSVHLKLHLLHIVLQYIHNKECADNPMWGGIILRFRDPFLRSW